MVHKLGYIIINIVRELQLKFELGRCKVTAGISARPSTRPQFGQVLTDYPRPRPESGELNTSLVGLGLDQN